MGLGAFGVGYWVMSMEYLDLSFWLLAYFYCWLVFVPKPVQFFCCKWWQRTKPKRLDWYVFSKDPSAERWGLEFVCGVWVPEACGSNSNAWNIAWAGQWPCAVMPSGRRPGSSLVVFEPKVEKIAIYCPQGSGTLRQQLLMMQGYYMVLHGIV